MPRHHHHYHGRGKGNPVVAFVGIIVFFVIKAFQGTTTRSSGSAAAPPPAPVFPDVQAQWEAFSKGVTAWLLNLTLTERLMIGGGVAVVMFGLIAVLGLLYWQAQNQEAGPGLD